MRIIGGAHRGRRLTVPHSENLRPTSDRAREAVFNILAHGLDWPGLAGVAILDVFAGTGAYGLEALSRGGERATFIDVDRTTLIGIRRNAAAIGTARAITLLPLDATRLPPPPRAAAPCGLAFLDAPYEQGLTAPALHGLAVRGWLDDGSLAVVEIGAREVLPLPPGYVTLDERGYGAARVLFLRRASLPVASG